MDGGRNLGNHGPLKLGSPFVLHLGDTKQSGTHYSNNDSSENGESAFPIVLGIRPFVFANGIEDADQSTTDDKAEQQTQSSTKPDLRECEQEQGMNGYPRSVPL